VFVWHFGQIESRKISKGQVRNDLAPVENVIVFDANSKTGAIVMNMVLQFWLNEWYLSFFKFDIQI
jgi:hypothetical protein